MAFDLNAFLQENRKFLAGSVVGLALFITGRALVGSVYGSELQSARFDVLSGQGKPRGPWFVQANLQEARAQEESLTAAFARLSKRVAFVPRPAFQIQEGGASPANQYLDIASRMREQRLDDARSRGIDLADNAGLPDRAPTQLEEIRRTLRGLDLADRVIGLAIDAGVDSIDRLQLAMQRSSKGAEESLFRDEIRVEASIKATSRALSAFLEATQASDPPLMIAAYDAPALGSQGRVAATTSTGEALVQVAITFEALEIGELQEN